MKIAYADCFSGISGDMFLGALIDAGLSLDALRAGLAGLPLPDPYDIQVDEVHKGALRATLVRVQTGSSPADRPAEHRHLADIEALINAGQLSERVRKDSLAVFRLLAQAEARVHGQPLEQVHFHEVGALDSIVDIIGAALGLEALGIERLYASALPMGSGTVQSQHGLLPLPAPATLELMALAGAPVVPSPASSELVTPTGAALLGALGRFEQPAMRVMRTGVGAGQRDLPWPNVMRLIVGEGAGDAGDELVQMETNIDDMNPQAYGPVMDSLLAGGALDVFLTPIQMKKNRPATLLGVIARRSDEAALARILLAETTTLGVRVHPITRHEAGRDFGVVPTLFGEIRVKYKLVNGEVVSAAPEYEDVARLAREQKVPFQSVYSAAVRAVDLD